MSRRSDVRHLPLESETAHPLASGAPQRRECNDPQTHGIVTGAVFFDYDGDG